MMNITVIGIGKLGLGLALLIENIGCKVCGVDISEKYVEQLNNKNYCTFEPKYKELLDQSKSFTATTDLEFGLNFADLIFIVVQTPNNGGDKFYDHSILSNLLVNINKYAVSNKHFIIGCTVMPKYINEIGNLLIQNCKECSLSYNPEFVAQGEIINGFQYPDIILIGTNSKDVPKLLKSIYQNITKNTPKYCIMSPLEAELVKISINGFITAKLSYANIISDVCDIIGARKRVVLESVGHDQRIGNKYFRPGYSFGGPCFPRDTKALSLFLKQNKIDTDLINAISTYNEEHIKFQAEQLLRKNKNTYVIENVCFKENSKIPIIEESAKLKIAKYLVNHGKKVIIKDNKLLIDEVKKEYGNIFDYDITEESL